MDELAKLRDEMYRGKVLTTEEYHLLKQNKITLRLDTIPTEILKELFQQEPTYERFIREILACRERGEPNQSIIPGP